MGNERNDHGVLKMDNTFPTIIYTLDNSNLVQFICEILTFDFIRTILLGANDLLAHSAQGPGLFDHGGRWRTIPSVLKLIYLPSLHPCAVIYVF